MDFEKIFSRWHRFVKSLKDELKLTYLVGQDDLSGRLIRSLIGRQKITFCFKTQPICCLVGDFGSPSGLFLSAGVRKGIIGLWNCDISFVGSVTFCSILKLSCDLIRRYVVPYFLQKKSLLLPTYYEIRGLAGSQDSAHIHSSVPTSLTNLYTLVVATLNNKRPLYRLHQVACIVASYTGDIITEGHLYSISSIAYLIVKKSGRQ